MVGVHIADVSHFVREGGHLDSEARARGTTVYLVDRRLDMLPALLSENLCSLHAGVDRLAVSVVWTLDSSLEVVRARELLASLSSSPWSRCRRLPICPAPFLNLPRPPKSLWPH